MDHRPIGVFDSGLGGLTAVKALRKLMPEEDILYFGDTGRMPYGPRQAEEIRCMTRQDLDFVAALGVKTLVAACGTVSCNAEDILSAYPLPVIGVLSAGVKALAKAGGEGCAAVIATQASISSGAYERAFRAASPGRELLSVACPDFVPLIENGHTKKDDPLLKDAVARALRPLKEAGVSALLLGCTHYGIIGRAIAAYLGPDVELISASDAAALEARDYLIQNQLTGGEGRELYYTSGSVEVFTAAAAAFLGWDIEGRVRQASVMEVEESC